MQNGDQHYVGERPCKRDHLGLRLTATGTCIECRRQNEKNRYWNNHEKALARANAKSLKNREKLALRAKHRRTNETPEQKAVRLEKARIKAALWRETNPNHFGTKLVKKRYSQSVRGRTKKNAHSGKRRAALIQRTPQWLADDDLWVIEQAYELAVLRTKMFGFNWHVDHIIPLQGKLVSGLHAPNNLQVIPGKENLAKHIKFTPA
jgi:hypothetical protein